jgi:carboxylate-amine ligase
LSAHETGASPSADALAELFSTERALTFGVEEEVMMLDPETFDLAPRASEALARLPDLEPVKLELPASQLEIFTPPRDRLDELADDLRQGRRRLATLLDDVARIAAAGTHPFAAAEGALNGGRRYERMKREYGSIARRQLVCGLHVHAAIPGQERVLAVYNAMRSHLPEIAALAANAPFHGGEDAGVASVRPLISAQLPRQGVPPAYESWQQLADDLRWGNAASRLEGFQGWWWELRLHAGFGTLEVRVPDAQTRPEEALAVVAFTAGLVSWLCARHDARELPEPAPGWRIAENRWSAARDGARGRMADVYSGALRDTAELLEQRLSDVSAFAAALGAARSIEVAGGLIEMSGADRQRELARELGLRGLAETLAEEFT